MQGDMIQLFELAVEPKRGYLTARKKGSSTPCWRTLGLVDITNPNYIESRGGETAQNSAPIASYGTIAAGEKDQRNACNYSDLPRSQRTKKG